MRDKLLLLTLLSLTGCAWMFPYKRIPANRGVVREVEGKFYSPSLKKIIPYHLVMPVLPEGSAAETFPVVYFLHGRNGTRHLFRDLGGPGVMERYLGNGGRPFVVVSLTGAYSQNGVNYNTYWVNGVRPGSQKWASLLLREMMPWIEQHHKIGGKGQRMIAGISMGSHGAFQLALNSPQSFRCVAGHSLVLRDYKSMSSEFPGLFGGPRSFAQRDPVQLIKRYRKGKPLPFQHAWIDIGGKDDPRFIQWARNFGLQLTRLGFAQTRGDVLDVGEEFPDGDHTYVYWTRRLPEYLEWYGKCFTGHRGQPTTAPSN